MLIVLLVYNNRRNNRKKAYVIQNYQQTNIKVDKKRFGGKVMNLSEYIKELQKLEAEHGDKTVVYSHDDEGNCYQKVAWTGTVAYCEDEKEHFLERIDDDELDEYEKYDTVIIIN